MTSTFKRGNSITGEYAYAQAGATRLAPPPLRWPMRVLAIESNLRLSNESRSGLLRHGIELCAYSDGLSALLGFADEHPSILVAPTDMSGVDLLAFVDALRAWTEIPIIVGIGNEPGSHEKAFHALEHGARSLIGLPFTGADLAAAIRNLGLTPASNDSADVLTVGPVTLDPQAFQVTVNGEIVAFTPREFHVLKYLMAESHRLISPEELSEQHSVYGDANVEGTRVVVLRIRKKLEAVQPGSSTMLQTVRGLGYRFVNPDLTPSDRSESRSRE